MDDAKALDARHVLQTYRRHPITLVRGEGVRLWDSDGREYFDLLSGIGVASLGHAHAALTAALTEQAGTLIHTSNLFYHPLQGQLAERLSTLSGLQRAFFCNSGTEAVEACLKLARRYWYQSGEERTEFVALNQSFHGRTFGALSVTSEPKYREPFAPLLTAQFVPPGDGEALASVVSRRTAAIIVEPIQGEGGVRPLTPEFAAALNETCQQTGALLIADEVQSGLGRTGVPFYSSTIGLKPRLMALGKALGGGVPIGAALIDEEVAQRIAYGDHGTTYGGNPLACRAALCVMDELAGGLMSHIERMGRLFESRLGAMAAKHSAVTEVRGAGLMWGLELKTDAAPVVARGFERGVILNRTAGSVVRLLPPFVISEADATDALARLDLALEGAEG
jgi:predicted acetylornithine/succinylornithine family transaminase